MLAIDGSQGCLEQDPDSVEALVAVHTGQNQACIAGSAIHDDVIADLVITGSVVGYDQLGDPLTPATVSVGMKLDDYLEHQGRSASGGPTLRLDFDAGAQHLSPRGDIGTRHSNLIIVAYYNWHAHFNGWRDRGRASTLLPWAEHPRPDRAKVEPGGEGCNATRSYCGPPSGR